MNTDEHRCSVRAAATVGKLVNLFQKPGPERVQDPECATNDTSGAKARRFVRSSGGGTSLVLARGSPAQRYWAIALTLILTAKLNGVEPMTFLTNVLERVVSGRTTAQTLQTPLPWN
jgi:hypothetical protein